METETTTEEAWNSATQEGKDSPAFNELIESHIVVIELLNGARRDKDRLVKESCRRSEKTRCRKAKQLGSMRRKLQPAVRKYRGIQRNKITYPRENRKPAALG